MFVIPRLRSELPRIMFVIPRLKRYLYLFFDNTIVTVAMPQTIDTGINIQKLKEEGTNHQSQCSQ